MFTTRTFIAAAVLSSVGFAANSSQANAASFGHVDSLAQQLTRQSSELYREFRLHYRHAAHYKHLMSDAAAIYRTAHHIHTVAHLGSVEHLDRDLRDLDRQFHHLEDLVAEIHDDAHHGHFGQLGHGGHVHGDVRHVRRLMRQMEDTIHHLRDDIRELLHDRHDHGHHDVHYRGRRVISPGISHSPNGISIRTGNFGFRIGL